MSFLLYFLLLSILIYLTISYKGDVAEPSIFFIIGFTIAVFNGLTNYKEWDFNLSTKTCAVILLGAIVFSAVSYCTKAFFKFHVIERNQDKEFTIQEQMIIPNWVYICFFLYTTISLYIVSHQVISITMPYGGDGSITRAIGIYDNLSKFSTEGVGIHGIAQFLYLSVNALSYIWLFLATKSIVIKTYHTDIFACINVLVSIPMTVITGGRNNLIQLGIATLAYYVLFTRQNNNWKGLNLSLRTVIKAVVLAFVALASFKPALSLLGRQPGDSTTYEYLSIYIGAPIKNLDAYLTNSMSPALSVTTSQWGDMTFASTRASFPHIFGGTVLDWLRWQPFQYYGTADLGNVYTTFYAFIFDWGISGALIAIAIIAFISQFCYEKAVYSLQYTQTSIPLSILLYGSISYCCAFCFFSNRWVSSLLNRSMLIYIIIWVFTICIFNCIKVTTNSETKKAINE